MNLTFALAAVMLVVILAFEVWRIRKGKPLGLLSVANLVFALNFCISPIFISLIGGTGYEMNPLVNHEANPRLYIFSLIETVNLGSKAYETAIQMAVLAYAGMLLGYGLVLRNAVGLIIPLQTASITQRDKVVLGSCLGGVALIALLLFSSQFFEYASYLRNDPNLPLYQADPTGVLLMMNLGAFVRGDIVPVSRGYLQILILLGVPSVMLISAAAIKAKGWLRWGLAAVALSIWLVVFARMFFAAGRLEFAMFVAIIPLAILFSMKSRAMIISVSLPLIAFGIFIGALGKEFFLFPSEKISELGDVLFLQSGYSFLFIINEFSFPHVVSAHAMQIAADTIGYRYFIDIPLAGLYMLPSLGGVDTWPPMLSTFHEEILPEIPYDLISYGFFNLGVLGVIIVFGFMGALLALFDMWLTPGAGWLVQCLRAGWMMYLPFRIMYADPYTSMKTGFGLIVGTILILGLVWLSKRRAEAA